MKLHYITGCICDSLSVDDKEFNDLSLEEQRAICYKLVDNARDDILQQMFITYMENNTEPEMSGPCECCGDLIFEYNEEI